jgi:hypothetical protein
MASFKVAGPCEIHCGVASGGGLAFLGWSEGGVRVSLRPFYEDVKADILGPLSPTTVQQMGEEAWVSLDLKIWNESVWRSIASRANARAGAAVAGGYYPNGAIGALVFEEDEGFRLLVYKSYQSKQINTAAGNIAAYNFPAAYLAGPDDVDPIGTRASKIRCVFRALLARDPLTGHCTLYNEDYSGKPTPA